MTRSVALSAALLIPMLAHAQTTCTSSTSPNSGAVGPFTAANGVITGANGQPFVAHGINAYDSDMGDASQMLAAFPGLNFVRLNVYSYQDPSAYASFIQTMSAAGVVVELEDHTNSNGSNAGGGSGNAFTGQQLTNEMNWYSSVAGAYVNNPYVWFGTDNEPPGGGLSTWEQQTYNAIRGAGNNNPIMMELPGGGYPNSNASSYGMDPSVYSSMSNIAIDAHFYGWDSNYSTDQPTVNNALTNLVQGAQTIQSANGTVPVIIGEYGPSTTGVDNDPNGAQVQQAVQNAPDTSGSVAWGWNTGQNDNLTDGNGNLTSFGQEVAQSIAAGGTPACPAAPVAIAAPTANDPSVGVTPVNLTPSIASVPSISSPSAISTNPSIGSTPIVSSNPSIGATPVTTAPSLPLTCPMPPLH